MITIPPQPRRTVWGRSHHPTACPSPGEDARIRQAVHSRLQICHRLSADAAQRLRDAVVDLRCSVIASKTGSTKCQKPKGLRAVTRWFAFCACRGVSSCQAALGIVKCHRRHHTSSLTPTLQKKSSKQSTAEGRSNTFPQVFQS